MPPVFACSRHRRTLLQPSGHGGPTLRLQPPHRRSFLGKAASGAPAGGRRRSGQQPRPRRRDASAGCLQGLERGTGRPRDPETPHILASQQDPNAQDRAGRTALMYACMERAGPQVASMLLAAGADPTMEDQSGASALVYAIDAQDQPTLKVLLDACQAKGRDIIIIATETGATGGPLTRRYLPSPNSSPVSCMSPSDILLKTGSPNSLEGGNIFNFRGPAGQRGSGSGHSSSSSSSSSSSGSTPLPFHGRPPRRQRVLSEPWPAIPTRACLNRQTEGWGGEGDQGGGDARRPSRLGEETGSFQGGSLPRISQSLGSLTDPGHVTSGSLARRKGLTPGGLTLPPRGESPPPSRRNTLPSLQVTPPPSGVV